MEFSKSTKRKVVGVSSLNVSHSMPNYPVTKNSDEIKQLLQKTPVLKLQSSNWNPGFPTPINDGSLTPNQEAFGLLARFASGNVRMEGDAVQHLPIV